MSFLLRHEELGIVSEVGQGGDNLGGNQPVPGVFAELPVGAHFYIGNWDANVQKNDKIAVAKCKFRENFAKIKYKIVGFKNMLYL